MNYSNYSTSEQSLRDAEHYDAAAVKFFANLGDRLSHDQDALVKPVSFCMRSILIGALWRHFLNIFVARNLTDSMFNLISRGKYMN